MATDLFPSDPIGNGRAGERIYLVRNIKDGGETLVRAGRPGTAVKHVSGKAYCARVATQRDLERLLTDGRRVEDATPEPSEQVTNT